MTATVHAFPLNVASARGRVPAEEWAVRLDLAACFRIIDHLGWTHLTYNHISARVPGPGHHFLLNPFGFHFREITASSLVKVDLDGRILDGDGRSIDETGFVIHSAIHAARPEATCVLHTHTVAGMGISALECGLLPINMGGMRFYNRVGYHDFEGVSTELDERARIARDLGPHYVLIMRNHGLLTCGRSIAEAFCQMYHLEKACAAQLAAQATGEKLIVPSPAVCERTARQCQRRGQAHGDENWPAYRRLVDDLYPSYRS